MHSRIRTIILAAALAPVLQVSLADSGARRVLEEIAIGGPDGWDYATFDEKTRTVYIAHGSAIASLNVLTKAVKPHLASAQGAHIAVPFAAGTMLLVTHGKANEVTLNDATTGEVKATIAVDQKPDAAVVEPRTNRGFVMAAGAAMVDVIDLATNAVVAHIPSGGAPEAGAVDGRGFVYTHLEDRNALVVIDAAAMKVKATYEMKDCEEPSGIAYAGKGLILSACRNGIARISNAATGAEVATVPIGAHPDTALYDGKRQLGFVPCGDGTLTVISFAGSRPQRVEVVKTRAGARTGALDPVTGFAYLPTAELGPAEKPGGRPSIIPNTFKVVVVGQ